MICKRTWRFAAPPPPLRAVPTIGSVEAVLGFTSPASAPEATVRTSPTVTACEDAIVTLAKRFDDAPSEFHYSLPIESRSGPHVPLAELRPAHVSQNETFLHSGPLR
jgi:hypothetical protein